MNVSVINASFILKKKSITMDVARITMLAAISSSLPVMKDLILYASEILALSSPLLRESKNEIGSEKSFLK